MSEDQHKNTMPTRRPGSRLTIGYAARHLTDKNNYTVWQGVIDAARERGVNVISFFPRDLDTPVGFDAQANVLYDLVNADLLDGMVIWTATLVNYAGPEGAKRILGRYRSRPIVAIEKGGPEDIPWLEIDSHQSMREAVLHLIRDHGYRRIAFIRGPDATHAGARERYQAYQEVLSEYGLPLDPDLVSPPTEGLWGPEVGEEAIALLLDQRHVSFEAVMGANDNFAIGAMRALQARGIHIPGQVAVVGFDDQTGSDSVIPPLTTLSLQGYEQGRQATEMLLTLLEGGQIPERVTVPPKLVIRQSCGCINPAVAQAAAGPVIIKDESLEAAMAAQREKILSEMKQAAGDSAKGLDSGWAEQLLDAFLAEWKAETAGVFLSTLDGILRQVITVGGQVAAWANVISAVRRGALPYLDSQALRRAEDLWLQAQVMIGDTAQQAQRYQAAQLAQQTQILNEIRAALITTFDVKALSDTLAQELPRLGIPGCYLSLYENPQRPTETSRLILAYDKRRGWLEPEAGKQVFPSRRLAPEGMLPQERPYSLVVEALHFREEQLGFVLFEAGPRDGPIYEALREQISSALQGAQVTQQVRYRALQLQAAAEVSRAASSILILDELLPQVVDLIHDRFNLYYVGLFLRDETGRYAVLRAGTGEAGRTMLDADHKLEVGGASMIGWCVANGKARIALDVGKDAVRFGNPLLPQTRSEMALPLISRGLVIGAMTIQSAQPAAFTQEDINILRTMADQLANAIENARLFTERARAEQALAEEQYLLQALMDNVPDYIYFKDRASRFIRTTRAHAKAFGLSDPVEAVGKTDFDFFTEEHARPAYEDEQEIIRTGRPLSKEERETWPDRPDTWVLTTKMPLRGKEGNIIGTFGISTDITDRKRTEEALRESEEKYRTILENIEDGYYEVDIAGNLTFFNDSLCRLYGYSKDEMMGMNYRQYMDDETVKAVYQTYNTVYRTGRPTTTFDWEVIRKDGTRRLVQVSVSLMRGPTGEPVGFRGIIRDITEHKQAEAERERLLATLEHRSAELQTAAEVSRATSSILDPEALIQQVVDRVRERFNLYYAGLFLVDQTGEWAGEPGRWAVLRAGTGEAGRQMLAQGHKLEIGGASMIGWCVAHQQARIALDVGKEAIRFSNPLLPQTRSEMALPLISRGLVIGAMTIQSDQPSAFTQEDITVLQTMADQVANAIENARLFEDARSRAERLAVVNRIARAANAILNLDNLMEAVYREVLLVFQSDSFYIALYDQGTNELDMHFIVDEGVRAPQERVPLTGLPSVVITEKRPLLIRNEQEREHLPKSPYVFGTKKRGMSWLGAPLAVGERVLGIINIQSYRPYVWDKEDEQLLVTIADQVAVALENARLFEETKNRLAQLTALQETAKAVVSTLELNKLLHLITQQATALLQGDGGIINLVNWEKKEDEVVVSSGSAAFTLGYRTPLDGSLSGWVALHNQPLISNQLPTDTRADPRVRTHAQNSIIAPLTIKDQVIGSLVVHNKQGGKADFNQADLDLLVPFANQAAIAIQNARLFEQTRATEERLALAVRGTNDGIWDWDIKNNTLYWSPRLKEMLGYAPDELQIDFDTFDRLLHPDDRKLTQAALDAHLKDRGPYDVEQRQLTKSGEYRWFRARGQAIWDEAGNAIRMLGFTSDITERKQAEAERERLLADLEHRALQLQTAAEVSRAASSLLNLDELLPQVVELIRDRFNLYYVGLFLVDETGQYAVLRAGTGEAGQKMLAAGHQLEVGGSSMIGWCVANGQARIALDVGEEAVRFGNLLLPLTRSEMALPLVSRGHVIGAMTIQSDQPAVFTQEDITVLQAMADQLANAIENSRLFEETKGRLAQLTALQETAKAVVSTLELDKLLSLITQQATALLQGEGGIINLVDWEKKEDEVVTAGGSSAHTIGFRSPLKDSLSGWVALHNQPVISNRLQNDNRVDVYVRSGEIRERNAAIAPLIIKDQVIGTLVVMNKQGGNEDFNQADLDLLVVFANQAAIAIQNARLFEQTQGALKEMEATQRRYMQQVWTQYIQATKRTSYETEHPGIAPLADAVLPEIQQAVERQSTTLLAGNRAEGTDYSALVAPIAVRGALIGALGIHDDNGKRQWTEADIALVESVAERMALAAENLRLLDETQRRAARERLINEITARIRNSVTMEGVLNAAVREIGQVIGASSAAIDLELVGTEGSQV